MKSKSKGLKRDNTNNVNRRSNQKIYDLYIAELEEQLGNLSAINSAVSAVELAASGPK